MEFYREIAAAASKYRRSLRWSVVPVRGKKAACRWRRFAEVRPSAAEVGKLFQRRDVTGLAVICGPASDGLAVRDFDDATVFEAWLETHAKLARELPIARTRRGGHVYIRGPEGFATLPDGEYRGTAGHYVVAPPSLHPDGGRYAWLNPPGRRVPSLDPAETGLLTPAQAAELKTHQPTDLSWCAGVSEAERVERAITGTLPAAAGQRNRRLWRLAVALRGIEGLDASAPNLRRIVADWHKRALPVIRTKAFDETWADFVRAWERSAEQRWQRWSLQATFAAALSGQVPRAALCYDTPAMRGLVSICAALQDHAGDGPFFLSCRTAADALGIDKMLALRMLHTLRFDGLLEMVELGTVGTWGRATAWRFKGR